MEKTNTLANKPITIWSFVNDENEQKTLYEAQLKRDI